jgi:WD40 repeat protein
MSTGSESSRRSFPAAALPTEAWNRQEEALEHFENAWRRGERPVIENYLAAEGPERRAMLLELAHVELELRQKAGETARAQDYFTRFPELADDPGAPGLIHAEFRLRRRREPALSAEDFFHAYPGFATQLAVRLGQSPPRMPERALETPSAPAQIRTPARLSPGGPPASDDRATSVRPVESGSEATVGPGATRTPAKAPVGLPAVASWPSLPGYDVLGLLGRGGMGVVYRAQQHWPRRLVALKMVLGAELASPEELVRFLAEAEAVAKLQHPNIVQLYEVGHHDDRPYYTMEFVEGGSLAQKLAGTPLPPAQAARLTEALAQAIEAAHRAGVIHRDLKPSNVLLTLDGTPKVTDFGAAKRLGQGEGLTRTGEVMGTPSYMAPEQAQCHKDVGPGADVYGLGAILYELLTGRPPFKAATSLDTLELVRTRDPIPPSRLQPKVPRELETICLKCLSKQPPRRYASAGALAADLGLFLAGKPISARPVSPFERAFKWTLRRPAPAALLAVSVTAASAILGGAFWHHAGLAKALAETEQERDAARRAKENEKTARLAAQRALVEPFTAAGLTAHEHGDAALAALWFANAAKLSRNDSERESANQMRVQTWSRELAVPVRAFAHPDAIFRSIAFHPSLPYLLALSTRDRVVLWNFEENREVSLPGTERGVTSALWSPDGNRLALGCLSEDVEILDFATIQVAERLPQRGRVDALAFSPSGRYLAIAAGGRTRVWHLPNRCYVPGEVNHTRRIRSLAFNAKEDVLVTDCEDQKARLFPISDNGLRAESLFPPLPHWWTTVEEDATAGRPVAPLCLDDQNALLTLETPTLLAQWDARSGQRSRQFPCPLGEGHNVESLALSGDRSTLAVGWHMGAQLWNVKTGQPIGPFLKHPNNVTAGDFRPNSAVVLLASQNRARLWQPGQERPLWAPLCHSASVTVARFSPRGNLVATGEDGGLLRLWALPAAHPDSFHCELESAYSRAFLSRDGQYFLPSSMTFQSADMRTTRVYDARTGRPVGLPLKPDGIILDAALSHDNFRAAVAVTGAPTPQARHVRPRGAIQIWDWRQGRRSVPPIDLPAEPRGLAFSPDGRHLAVLCAPGQLWLLEAATGQVVRRMQTGADYYHRWRPNHWNFLSNGLVRFSPNGTRLATWGTDEKVWIWDVATGQAAYAPLAHGDRCYDVHFSSAGDWIVTASWDKTVRVWDLKTGEPLSIPLAHPDRVYTARFSPDGEELLTACRDGIARVWNWRRGQPTGVSVAHEDEVLDVAYMPDKPWLLSTGNDKTFRLWERASGRLLMPPQPLGGLGFNLCLPPDGHSAIVGALGGNIWGFHLERLIQSADAEELCTLAEVNAGRRISEQGNVVTLTPDEWQQRWRGIKQLTLPAATSASPAEEKK